MSQYLTKEEIKMWRSSLEKITLEDYAKRLGKTLKEEKETSDIIDIVMQNEKRLYTSKNLSDTQPVLQIAQKAQAKQNEILETKEETYDSIRAKLTVKKALTQREETVLKHFIEHRGKIVFARDLADILELPTDYVYKYIKNLRTKISEEILKNATKGGYTFSL